MALPVITLTIGNLAGTIRYVRNAMIEVISKDFIRTARSKGLSEKVIIYSHAFRNALIPVVTLVAGSLVGLFGGAYSPAPVVTADVFEKTMNEVMRPTVEGMKKDGHIYTGFLYAGLMIDDKGQPKVIEFNCRFGDPETQPIMMRLKSSLVDLVEAGIAGNLPAEAEWDERKSIGIVLAAEGYPETVRQGDVISRLWYNLLLWLFGIRCDLWWCQNANFPEEYLLR
jgi:hypothetical protein